MAYLFYIDGVQVPVTPSKLQVKINNKNKTATLINDGEINIIKNAGLTDISFEVLLPNSKYPFASYVDGFKPAAYYVDKIEKLKNSNKPFQFIVTRTKQNGDYLFDTNIKVSLEDYTITEDAEKLGMDVSVSIKLKQFKEYCTKVLTLNENQTNTSSQSGSNSQSGINNSSSTVSDGTSTKSTTKVATIEKNRASSKTTPKTYTVKSGDTLWVICKKYLGYGEKYKEIAKLNDIKNVNLIKVGQVIRIE